MPRIPDDVRAAILDDIKAGQKSRNQIARDHHVGVGSVTNIAKHAGLTDAFDRSSTKNATEAARLDNAALRATTSRRLLEEANRFLDDLHRPHVAFNFGGKDNSYNEREMPEPPIADKRNLMTAAAIAIDKHLAVEKHDHSGESHASVDAWLDAMGA